MEIQRLSNVLSIERAPTYPYENAIKCSQIAVRTDEVVQYFSIDSNDFLRVCSLRMA